MSGLAWRRYWGVFAGLLLSVALLALWQGMMASLPDRQQGVASKAGLMSLPDVVRRQGAENASSARISGLIVPAGFMRAPSGKLLPRFASLAVARAEVRLGPGEAYPVAWIIRSPHLPLEVLAEANGWLRIRDHEGEEGWIRARALSEQQRTALVAPWRQDARLPLRAAPEQQAPLKAWVGSGVVVRVLACDGSWCEVRAGTVTGWLQQPQLWGVYHDERIHAARG